LLDTETKKRIDDARLCLVGKIPVPQSQVDQITIALIYKFMNDMDAESEEFGGQRKFFAGDFARYSWPKLMHSGLSGYEVLNLYAEAISTMPENPGIPQLFRNIFKHAFLPYRDPETLRMFLKVIDGFTYDHSERLGDAFEYLLLVLGSQGDAGQFRTPRHIIEFIVDIIYPKKDETILDPACGTAGFLISSYKHIRKANTDAKGENTLTPDERGRLAQNIKGYDISPDMVRLSLVNLYLHGFVDPHIFEYDTLTSLERWNEYADVILANPPFMSPKGGIKPHNRFTIQAKRSEVLFVDYMAEHLNPNGRAGIIVPEGIIFQSQNAYINLRKMLVDDYLVAVISLPAGVFNPYAGVKTSILILDKSLAKRANTIGFFKVNNDGFHLGAQRRPIEANDLPQALSEIGEYLRRLHAGESVDDFQPTLGLIVPKEKIAANGDYNLSGERYREETAKYSSYPAVELGEVCELVRGVVFKKEDEVSEGGVKVLRANNIDKDLYEINLDDIKQVSPKTDFSNNKKLKKNDIFICLASGSKDHIGKVALIREDTDFYFGGFMGAIRVRPGRLRAGYLLKQLTTGHFNDYLREQIAGANINNLSSEILYRFQIPLPPLDVQQAIVAEIEGYQKVIDGARAVIANYRPHIPVDPTWPMVEIGKVCDLINGTAFKPSNWEHAVQGGLPIVRIQNLNNDNSEFHYYSGKISPQHIIESGELLFSWSGSRGTSFGAHIWRGGRAILNQHIFKVKFHEDKAIKGFLFHSLNSAVAEVEENLHGGVGLVHITKGNLERIKIPLPPLATQQAIVAEIEAEQALVNANRDLIKRMEQKIQAVLARIWGAAK